MTYSSKVVSSVAKGLVFAVQKLQWMKTKDDAPIDGGVTLKQVMKSDANQKQFGLKTKESERRKKETMKDTYPMCMGHFRPKKASSSDPEPVDLCVFALVSKEVKVMQMKLSGTRKTFEDCASISVDGLPTDMDIEQHKVTNKMLVVVAMQGISQKLLQKKDREQQDTSGHNLWHMS